MATTMQIEVTDTFSGEANYSWVRRYSVQIPAGLSRLAIVRRAKNAAMWTGTRCTVSDYGDSLEIRPAGVCQVMFVTFDHE